MNIARRQFLHSGVGAAVLPALSRLAKAQGYPVRPVTMVVPYAAGGPLDAIARIMSERMRLSLGQPIVIENATGAGGTIGVLRVVRAAPDGYTVSFGNFSSHTVLGATYQLPFDLLTDLEPVARLPENPMLIVTRKSVPANNLKELFVWLKDNQNKVSVGTSGVGGGSHIAGVFLQNVVGARFQFVPYRGAGPAMNDMVAGQIDLMVDATPNSLPHVRAGSIKAYAVTAKTRMQSAPDIPTTDEAGAPGLHIAIWNGIWTPKGTPKDAIARLNAAAMDAMADPEVRSRLTDLGLEFPRRDQQTAEALGALQKAEIEKWWPIIKAAGIKVD
jgi:tripartite-type tricarboxylate transporter receptor subunit TctC